jgi:deazaflavin-dependent oxidoreductase (nitroreductase family)
MSMTEVSANAWEDALVAEMRAHDGKVTTGPLAGHPLLIMTSTGAKTGKSRRAVLTWSRDGDDYIVAGTKGGSPEDPLWVSNVRVTPEVTIEVGNRVIPAAATIVEGAERDRLWDAHVRKNPWFGEYPDKTARVIPMIRLAPRGV